MNTNILYKRLLTTFLLLSLTIQVACSQANPDNIRLNGKYKVDINSLYATDSKKEAGSLQKLAVLLATLSVDMHISFYKNGDGLLRLSGTGIDIVNALSEKPIRKIHSFVYKIKLKDATDKSEIGGLYMKNKGEKEYSYEGNIVRIGQENDLFRLKTKDADILLEKVKH